MFTSVITLTNNDDSTIDVLFSDEGGLVEVGDELMAFALGESFTVDHEFIYTFEPTGLAVLLDGCCGGHLSPRGLDYH